MGCKQTKKIRKHSYISDIKGRPIEDILDQTIYVGNIPDFVNEFIYQYTFHQLKYIKGQYKDLFFCDNKVYGIEKISKTEFERRKILQKKIKNIKNVVMYSESFYLNGCIIGIMDKYEMDLFELLKCSNIDIIDFVSQISSGLTHLHKCGVYIQDLKPENIFVNIDNQDRFVYYIADIEYAFMDSDFSNIISRPWIRTLHYTPCLRKPKTKIEAVRNDYYAFAVMIGRIETFYHNNLQLNVFCEPRTSILEKDWDDRYKLEEWVLIYSKFCSDFIVERLYYKNDIINFIPTLLGMNQQ